jgi:hypothetical protein
LLCHWQYIFAKAKPLTNRFASPAPRKPLDRAILASVLAMAAMNIFVLAQQLQPAPMFAAVDAAETGRA